MFAGMTETEIELAVQICTDWNECSNWLTIKHTHTQCAWQSFGADTKLNEMPWLKQ